MFHRGRREPTPVMSDTKEGCVQHEGVGVHLSLCAAKLQALVYDILPSTLEEGAGKRYLECGVQPVLLISTDQTSGLESEHKIKGA